jgi:hypothetical protein
MSALGGLFPGMDAATFSAQHYTRMPLTAAGDLARLPSIASEPKLRSAAALIAATSLPRINAYATDDEGRHRHLRVAPDSAEALLDCGLTIEVSDAGAAFPPVRELLLALAGELGESAAQAVAIISPRCGVAVPLHFDHHDVFVLQLAGKKRWRVGPAPAVQHPLHSYAPAFGAGQRDAGTWAPYFPASFPTAMPSGATTFDLMPGSSAYVPAGFWHETWTLEPSISLTLSINPQRFVTAFVRAVEARLSAVAELRQPLLGSVGDAAQRYEARQKCHELIACALRELAQLQASELVPQLAAELRYVKADETTFRVEGHALSVRVAGEPRIVLRLGELASNVASWLEAARGDFGSAEALRAGLRASQLERFFKSLVQVGALLPAPT